MRETLRLFFNYYKQPKKNFFIFIFFSICNSLIEVITIFLFYIYIKFITENSINFYLSEIIRFFYNYIELNYFILLSSLLIFLNEELTKRLIYLKKCNLILFSILVKISVAIELII